MMQQKHSMELVAEVRRAAPNESNHGFDAHDITRRIHRRTGQRHNPRIIQGILDELRRDRLLESRMERTHPGGPRRPVYWKPEGQGGRG